MAADVWQSLFPGDCCNVMGEVSNKHIHLMKKIHGNILFFFGLFLLSYTNTMLEKQHDILH